jgi:hypothetical protein
MIDYGILHKSSLFYENLGYARIESPWTVSEKVDNITRPSHAVAYKLHHNGKCLVASGEQSFLYLGLKGFLPKGVYHTITPCFRDEYFDFLHTKYFMKNELINTKDVSTQSLERMIDHSFEFYQQFFKKKLEVVKTEIGFDIEVDGKELGSYGIRSCEFMEWVYGTGCAEPRTSNLINLYGIS